VGTFFAIGSHDASSTPHSKVNTFVRLGNGFEKGSEANYEPVKFNKVNLRLRNFIEMWLWTFYSIYLLSYNSKMNNHQSQL